MEAPAGRQSSPPLLLDAYEAVAQALFDAGQMRSQPPSSGLLFEDMARSRVGG